jgi:hygromycin-B 7''-O-kinase
MLRAMAVPTLPNVADYQRVFLDDATWRGAVQAIADRHRLVEAWERAPRGSNVVFLGARHVIKLFCPKWGHEARIETCALQACAGRLPVASPAVVAEGEIEGWPYLVLTRLQGRELAQIWGGLHDERRRSLVVEAAELLVALHSVAIPDGAPLPEARPVLERPLARALDKHRADGTDPRWVEEIGVLLEGTAVDWPGPDVLVHGDVHPEHLLVDDASRLAGLFDFADTLRGPIEYDLAATACLMACHVEGGARAFHAAYGYDLDDAAYARLGAALLRQRYCALPFAVANIPVHRRPDSVADLLALVAPR